MLILIFIFIVSTAHARPPARADEAVETVVVTGDGQPSPLGDTIVATQVIDRETIEASGAVTVDQLLEMVPGLQVLDGLRGPTLSLRGHDPAHTLVMVDGRRSIGRVGGELDLRRMTADRIERIEIVRGPTSALYGADALAGVVNILTRDARDAWSVEGRVQAGGYVGADGPLDDRAVLDWAEGAAAGLDQLGVDVAAGFATAHVRGRAGVGLQALDGWDRSPDAPGTDGDRQRMIAPTVHLAVTPGPHEIALDLDALLVEGQGVDRQPAGAVLDRVHLTETWDGGVTGRFDLQDRVTLVTRLDGSLYRDQLRQEQRRSDALDSLEETRQALGRALVQASGHVDRELRHQLLGGVEAMLEDLHADRITGGHAGRQRGAAWLQHQWRILDEPGLAVLTGVRVDVDSLFGAFPAPRVALRLDPHARIRLRLACGGGFRAPDFRQLYLDFANPAVGYRVAGDPGLRPERSVGATADLEVRAHRDVQIALSGWHDSVLDLITTDLVGHDPDRTERYGYVNVGRARVQGLTLSLQLASTRAVHASLAYTLTDADDLDRDRPLPGRAEHQGHATVGARIDRIGLAAQVGGTVLGPRALYPTDDLTQAVLLPPMGLLDLRLAWTPPRTDVELFVGVDNLLDAGVAQLDATRPRRLYGGVSARFSPRGG